MVKFLVLLLLLPLAAAAQPSGAYGPGPTPGFTGSIASTTQTSNYTLALSDVNSLINMSVTSNSTLTVPPNASVAFPVGAAIQIRNTSAVAQNIPVLVMITPGSGVTINALGSLNLIQSSRQVQLQKTGTNTWILTGNEPILINSDYALTTTDGAGATNVAQGVMQIWGPNGASPASGVSCGPGPSETNGTGTLSSRLVTMTTGGPTNGPYRQFNVISGDNWGGFGVRCEIGELDWRFGDGYNAQWVGYSGGYFVSQGTFALFREGQHRIIDFDIQLESSFTLSSNAGFQQVLQVKQAQPNTNAQNSGSPVLEIDARNNLWGLWSTQGTAATALEWSTAATLSTWYHIRLDCNYSQFTTLGWCQMIVTPWSGGVLGTPVVGTVISSIQTLGIETGNSDLLPIGTSIPSALLVGPYVRTGSPTEAIDMTNFQIWDAT